MQCSTARFLIQYGTAAFLKSTDLIKQERYLLSNGKCGHVKSSYTKLLRTRDQHQPTNIVALSFLVRAISRSGERRTKIQGLQPPFHFMTSAGHLEPLTTLRATLPIKYFAMPVFPREAITIKSIFFSFASLSIVWQGTP